jgi:hypothetical protein
MRRFFPLYRHFTIKRFFFPRIIEVSVYTVWIVPSRLLQQQQSFAGVVMATEGSDIHSCACCSNARLPIHTLQELCCGLSSLYRADLLVRYRGLCTHFPVQIDAWSYFQPYFISGVYTQQEKHSSLDSYVRRNRVRFPIGIRDISSKPGCCISPLLLRRQRNLETLRFDPTSGIRRT